MKDEDDAAVVLLVVLTGEPEEEEEDEGDEEQHCHSVSRRACVIACLSKVGSATGPLKPGNQPAGSDAAASSAAAFSDD